MYIVHIYNTIATLKNVPNLQKKNKKRKEKARREKSVMTKTQ